VRRPLLIAAMLAAAAALLRRRSQDARADKDLWTEATAAPDLR